LKKIAVVCLEFKPFEEDDFLGDLVLPCKGWVVVLVYEYLFDYAGVLEFVEFLVEPSWV
jgi:hypothetical protein